MPIYEYICDGCANQFEELVLKTDDEVKCPKCSSVKLSKKMSACAMKSGSKYTSTSSGDGCSTCASKNCGSCN